MTDKKNKTVAITGNPNCGKTTLFNGLTGGRQIIGNWPGVTVERLEGHFHREKAKIKVVDLPGIYSLSASSIDEKVTRDYILSHEADIVINVIDASNLERNLYLTTQLIEMNVPIVIVLNRIDIAKRHNIEIDSELLSRQTGIRIIELNATRPDEIDRMKEFILAEIDNPVIPSVKIEYPDEAESMISRFSERFSEVSKKFNTDTRWVCVKILENDDEVSETAKKLSPEAFHEFMSESASMEKLHGESPDIIIADYRYGFIHGLIAKVKRKRADRQKTTDIIDRFVLNKITGIPIFAVIMFIVFSVTMNIGGAFINFFDIISGAVFIDGSRVLLESFHTPEWIITIISNGIGAGIQAIATFIPIIFFMFLMLAFLEDSGYMARAAFIMDRLMRYMGLPGKSFVPMIVGFGCTVPAIMATRTLDNYRDRVMTVFMTPFMSCGARLPVYAIFAAAFFGRSSGFVVFSLYVIGIVLSILTGILLKKKVFKGEVTYFVMELPTYNYPRFKHIMIHTWNRLKIFISNAGKVIIIGIMVLSFINSLGTDLTFGNEGKEKSILSQIGRTITPVFTPMGIEKENWPASVALFTGIFAKEAVVGTLTSLYSQLDASENENSAKTFNFPESAIKALSTIPENIKGIFQNSLDPFQIFSTESDTLVNTDSGNKNDSLLPLLRKYFKKGKWQAYAYLLFILVYFPCLAATGTIFREIGYMLGIISVAYLTVLAWAVSTIFYQLTVGRNILFIFSALAVFAAIYVFFILFGKRAGIKKICREEEC